MPIQRHFLSGHIGKYCNSWSSQIQNWAQMYEGIFRQKILVCDVFISLREICKFYSLLCVT